MTGEEHDGLLCTLDALLAGLEAATVALEAATAAEALPVRPAAVRAAHPSPFLISGVAAVPS